MSVLVFAETEGGIVKGSSHEAVCYASKVANGSETVAVVLGDANADALADLGKYGATKVLHVADSRLNDGVIQATATSLAQVADSLGAETVVMARSSLVDAVAARVAVKLAASVVANVTSLPEADGSVQRGIYTGKAFVKSGYPCWKESLDYQEKCDWNRNRDWLCCRGDIFSNTF